MLSVILGILKIIGTVLLWILAVILVILLLILFVPIRYNGKGSYDREGSAEFRAGWLFRLIHFRFTYYGKPEASAGILWFRIWKWPDGEEREDGKNSAVTGHSGPLAEDGQTEAAGNAEAAGKTDESSGYAEAARTTRDSGQAAEYRETAGTEEAEYSGNAGSAGDAGSGGQAKHGTEKNAAAAGQKISGFVKQLPDRLRAFFETLKRKWNAVGDKEKFYRRMISDERNQRFFRFFLTRVKRILKDLLPRGMNGKLCFGFADPYTTGQVLSYAALLLPWYHDKLKIVPVFEHQELKADVTFRGRIYMFILLVNGLSVWFNRDFRRIYRILKKRRK